MNKIIAHLNLKFSWNIYEYEQPEMTEILIENYQGEFGALSTGNQN